jgi:hypothetical protein
MSRSRVSVQPPIPHKPISRVDEDTYGHQKCRVEQPLIHKRPRLTPWLRGVDAEPQRK